MNPYASRPPSAALGEPAIASLFARLYEAAAEDRELDELPTRACEGLARALHMPLVVLGQRDPSGAVVIRATSSRNALWAALHRIPERWDGSLVGDGAAGRVMKDEDLCRVRVTDRSFLPWREAALAEDVRCAVALRERRGDDDDWALEYFCRDAEAAEDPAFLRRLSRITGAAFRFLSNVQTLSLRRLQSAALESAGNPVLITDREARIVWANAAFAERSGRTRGELLGRNPNILKSGKQGLRYYRQLWQTLRAGQVWRDETVDRDRSGADYTVLQTISPVVIDDSCSHYVSIQADITLQKQAEQQRELAAERDASTQLYTRAVLEQHVAQALRERRPVALVALSAARLLDAAARHGAAAVTAVHEALAERVLTIAEAPAFDGVRPGILRQGEFVLAVCDAAAAEPELQRFLDALAAELRAPYPVDGIELPADIAFSAAVSPRDGASFDELLVATDARLARGSGAAVGRVP